jgi:hypothetical protein
VFVLTSLVERSSVLGKFGGWKGEACHKLRLRGGPARRIPQWMRLALTRAIRAYLGVRVFSVLVAR